MPRGLGLRRNPGNEASPPEKAGEDPATCKANIFLRVTVAVLLGKKQNHYEKKQMKTILHEEGNFAI